ncbi:MAG: bifunctional UDP-N-acetylmuramoyl-tripeptide:D-alanyl-D-alanine ligase/alanine racemase [Flavipsychrobacter sp.]|nr:bifunctional UDP-N-acetylmuramoyl-tripeptide:D-alanyl-D-alanine ligase/alanine racemase [Flavipsychrobacter sp.]
MAAAHKVTIEEMTAWCHGTLSGDGTTGIEHLLTDSRKINDPANSLFIALKTKLRNGHDFIADAYAAGVRNFLVSEAINTEHTDVNVITVKDTLTALQQIVATYRKRFDIPVIGITGSNGKTMVKEWLYQLLTNTYTTLRSPKSYNSQVGVPLSVWLLDEQTEVAIFEAGISQPGEMEKLEQIIRPTIGVFTNIGEAHSEGFMNIRQKINEKLVLFRHVRQLIYCKDYLELNECIGQYARQVNSNDRTGLTLFTWSAKHEADLTIKEIVKTHGTAVIHAVYKKENISISIPFTDTASIENAVNCWCVLLAMNMPQELVHERMPLLQPVSMRLELRHGINDSTIIDDTYNSDLTSLHIAIDYLEQQKQHQHHTVILSDMLQAGRPDADLYEEVAALLNRRNVQRFIGIGPALYKNKATFRKHKKLRSIFFKSTEDFLKKFHLITFDHEAILLKGARAFAFEKIGMLLEQKVHQTVLSINLSAMTHNRNVFRSILAPGVKIMAMVKAFAYGSGSYEIASLLQYSGVGYLAVAYTDEGIALRKAGITLPIMVMSPDETSFDRMIAWKLEPELYNFRTLDLFTGIADMLSVTNYPVHIKLDTGMHRLGFVPSDLDKLTDILRKNNTLHVASIFSHLAVSDEAEQDEFTLYQAELFTEMSERIMHTLPHKPLRHLCNSSGIARHPELHFDMVRLGLGLYGIEASGTLQDKLKQISTLKTTIAQIKEIPIGDTIGYGRRAMAEQPMRIATISIGYADGYHRALGNGKAHVLIHGKPAKVAGVVCMDMCMVDITHIPEAAEGDDVIVFSPELTVNQLAEWAGTIPYEIMTGISQRVKRVYVNED